MHPLQYDLRCPGAKDSVALHMQQRRQAFSTQPIQGKLQSTKEIRATSEIAAPKPDFHATAEETRRWTAQKRRGA